MRVIYDKETDTLTFVLRKGKYYESDEVREGIIVDVDKKGKIIAIEILDASKYLDEINKMTFEIPREIPTKSEKSM